MNTIPDRIVSSNSGNGTTETVVVPVTSKGGVRSYKSHMMPSVRAKVTGDTFNGIDQHEIEYAEFNGVLYTFGEDSLVVPSGNETHRDGNRYGNPVHLSLVAYGIAKADKKIGTRKDPHRVDLAIFLPPGIYNESADLVRKRFENACEVEIHLSGEANPRRWVYENITIYPEGFAALMALGFDEKGKPVSKRPNIMGQSLVIDFGAGTFDVAAFVNGKPNPEYRDRSTFGNLGVYNNVLVRVAEALRQAHGDFRSVTPEHVDVVLRNGFDYGEWTIQMGRAKYDCQDIITQHLDELLHDCFAELDNWYHGLEIFNPVLVVGGIAWYALDRLKATYGPERFIDIADYPHLDGVHPVELNAVAGARLRVRDLHQQLQMLKESA